MKKVKILVSVLISMALLLALFVPAMASDYKITVTGKAGETYTAYKVFSFYYTGTGTNAKGVYTATPAVKNILSGVSGVTFSSSTYTDGGYVVTMNNTEATAKAVATKLSQNLATLSAAKTSTIPTGSTSVTLDVGSAGYYFVNTTMGTICNLTSTTPTAEISDKNTTVSVDKVIVEGSSTTTNNSVQIGDSVSFKTTVTIPVGAKNVVLHDKMEAGFTFGGSVSVKNGTTTIASTNYTFTKSGTDGCTFEIAFSESYLNSLTAAVSLTVEYSATLNENAEIASGNTNDNSTWATYGANQKTTVVTTKTSTYDFDLFKYTGDDVALAGAEFKLYTDSGDVSLVQESATSYRVAMSGETGSSIITSTDTDDGIINIRGLDGDITYYLKETKAPNGYNMDNTVYTIKSSATSSDIAFGAQIDVENSQGTLLPETGGTGTKILFAVGGVLVVVAFVLFTSKRRMSAEG